MKQAALFPVETACERGQHGELTKELCESDDAVDILMRCSVCGRLVQSMSWTKEAWYAVHHWPSRS